MKRFSVIFVIICTLLLLPLHSTADRRGFVNTVVIDPGHGGREPGAIGRNSREKDITLAISLKLGAYIKENLPDVKIIYTRKTDEFVPLHRRARIANENHADLFISIHCNSYKGTVAVGTETFVMGVDKNNANLEVARKENASILFEDDYMERYDGFDPHSPEANIIFSLYQNAYLEQSLYFASHVQDQFRDRAQRVDRGVKQAGFLVLYHITMPGVLIEAGFLSNLREEKYLLSETGQEHIASAVYRAFRDYKQTQDALAAGRKGIAGEPNDLVSSDQTGQLHPTDQNTPANSSSKEVLTPPLESNKVVDAPSQISQKDSLAHNNLITETNPVPPSKNLPIVFKVQFAVSQHLIPLDSPQFRQLNDVGYYYHDGLYKYTAGKLDSHQKANALLTEMRRSGYPDAFLVAFHNHERIPVEEAVKLMSQQ